MSITMPNPMPIIHNYSMFISEKWSPVIMLLGRIVKPLWVLAGCLLKKSSPQVQNSRVLCVLLMFGGIVSVCSGSDDQADGRVRSIVATLSKFPLDGREFEGQLHKVVSDQSVYLSGDALLEVVMTGDLKQSYAALCLLVNRNFPECNKDRGTIAEFLKKKYRDGEVSLYRGMCLEALVHYDLEFALKEARRVLDAADVYESFLWNFALDILKATSQDGALSLSVRVLESGKFQRLSILPAKELVSRLEEIVFTANNPREALPYLVSMMEDEQLEMQAKARKDAAVTQLDNTIEIIGPAIRNTGYDSSSKKRDEVVGLLRRWIQENKEGLKDQKVEMKPLKWVFPPERQNRPGTNHGHMPMDAASDP